MPWPLPLPGSRVHVRVHWAGSTNMVSGTTFLGW